MDTTIELTQRERDVLECIASGYNVHEIGQELSLHIFAIKRLKRLIYAKLKARNSSHAVYLALKKGILT